MLHTKALSSTPVACLEIKPALGYFSTLGLQGLGSMMMAPALPYTPSMILISCTCK